MPTIVITDTTKETMGAVKKVNFDKNEVTIGRLSTLNDIALSSNTVSKKHAVIRASGQDYIVEDVGSTSGTFVNGVRLEVKVPHTLGPEDRIYISTFILDVEETLPEEELSAAGADGELADEDVVEEEEEEEELY